MVVDLLHDARFWTAVVVLGNAILFYFVPGFPKEIWAAIDALLAVVIGSLAATSIAAQRKTVGGERGLLASERYRVDAQDVALLVGLVLLGVGLALYDIRLALIAVGGLLLGMALVSALRTPRVD